MGLCIKASYRNVAFRQETGGSTKYCSYLFNPVLGLTRWMPKETASVQHENPEANKLSLGQVEDDPLKVEHRVSSFILRGPLHIHFTRWENGTHIH